jgi:hypothetical protein
MKELRAHIEINAPAQRVWQVLTDFVAYSEWNPFIRRARGGARAGGRLSVYIQAPGSRGMGFKPRVLRATQRGFEEMNQALKERAERAAV